jgi:hypothetical protein
MGTIPKTQRSFITIPELLSVDAKWPNFAGLKVCVT